LGILGFQATVNQACCVFGGKSAVVVEFLFYWLLGLRTQVISLATGGGQPNISQEILRGLRVAAPSPGEQLKIVHRLDALMRRSRSLVDEVERAITLLHEHRTALISAAVTGKIDVRGLAEAA
jgi:type I restriction enzyme S subunit